MPRERQFSPLFLLVAIIAVVAALYFAKQILLPLALATLLSFLLTPLANRIERFHLPRIPATILVVLAAFAMFGILGWIVTDQLVALRAELPQHRAKIVAKTTTLKNFAAKFRQVGEEITNSAKDSDSPQEKTEKNAEEGTKDDQSNKADVTSDSDSASPSSSPPHDPDEEVESFASQARQRLREIEQATSPAASGQAIPVKVVEMPPSPLTQAQTVLGALGAPLTAAGMVIVLVFFMLLDRENQRNRLIQLFGTSNLHTTTEALHDATHRVGKYLRMQFYINAGYGVAVAFGLYFLGVPSAIMWGALGFTLRFLPYIGPWLAAVLPILVSLAVSDGWTVPILVGCMYVVYELILNNVAEPMLYGNSTGVSTVGVIISAIFWTWLWGPIGLLLAMPMTVCLVVMARYVPQLRFITVLLADEPPLSPAQRVYQRLLAFDYNEPLKLAHHHLKHSSLANFYDDIVIPALSLAERDRHAGLLNEEQETFVREATEDLIEDLGEEESVAVAAAEKDSERAESPEPHGPKLPPAKVLVIPLRDHADEVTSRMLAQLLTAEGFMVDRSEHGALTSEVVDRVASGDANLVIISVLPPIRPRDSRLLWKRLRQAYPQLPIIVGYWVGPEATESLLPPPGDHESRIATTLADAVKLARGAAAKLQIHQTESA